jgi:hypothetical protein
MPNRFTLNPDDLDELFERIGAERRRVGAHRVQWQANPTQAAMLADLAGRRYQMAPWVPPDAILAATLAGVDDEMFATLAESSGHATMARGGLIEAAQQEGISNPFGLAGVLASRTPEQQAQTQAEVDALRAAGVRVADEGGLWKYVKGASRVAVGTLQSGYEAATTAVVDRVRGIGDVGGALLEGDIGGAVGAAGSAFGYQALMPSTWQSTTAGQAVSQVIETGEVDAGEGYFVGGTVHAQQAQRAREVRGTVGAPTMTSRGMLDDGHAWTIGRLAASTVFEPGSKPYGYLSGAVDFAAALGLDPANYLIPGSGASRTRRAATVVPAGEARALGVAEEALTEAQRLQGVAGEAAKAGDLASFEGVSGLAAGRTAAATELVQGVEARTGVASARRSATPEWRAAVDSAVGIVDVPGMRRTVLAPKAVRWMYSTDGRRVVERVAQMTSPTEIVETFGRRIDIAGAHALAQADTPEKVMGVFGNVFNGGTLRELPTMGHWSGEVGPLRMRVMNRARDRYAIFGHMPAGTYMDPDDAEAAYRTLYDGLGNVHITGDERRALVDGWIAAKGSGQPGDMFRAMEDVGKTLQKKLVGSGLDAEKASSISDWHKAYGRAVEYLVDDMGNSISFDFLNGSKGPTRTVELLSSGQFIYDPAQVQKLRTVTSRWAKIPGFKGASATTSFVAHWQSRLWKPLVLVRPAYITRVVGEEVVRTLFGGRFRHASDWIFASMGHGYGTDLAGDTFDLGKRLTRIQEDIDDAVDAGRGVDDLLAEQQRIVERISNHYGDDYVDALAGKVRGRAAGIALRDDNMAEYMVRTGNWVKVNKLDAPKEWNRGQIEELIKLHRDPVLRRIANGGVFEADGAGFRAGLDGIEDWLKSDSGRWAADRMSSAYPGVALDDVIRELLNKGVVDVRSRTAMNPELLDVVANGRLNGAAAFSTTEKGASATPALRGYMDTWRQTDEAPQWVKFEQQMSSTAKAQRNALVTWFFGEAYGKSSDLLARSPTFRKHYWERVGEMASTMTAEEALRAIDNLAGVRLPAGLKSKIRTQLGSARGSASLNDVDLAAKGFALDETRKLLVDATNKSQLADVFRVVFPFGEAWREILTTWTRIGAENPRILNAARKTIVAGRSADPDQNGQGFLYENSFGREVFAYPLVGRAGEAFTGVNVAFEGELLGMSVSTQIIPGIGPTAQFLVSDLVPDTPGWDFVNELLFPYGTPEERDAGPLEVALPGWAQKVGAMIPGMRGWFDLDNPEANVVYGNTYMEVYSALSASGKYDLKNPQDLDRLDDDARGKAKILTAMRGLVQATGPASPGLAFKVATLEGDVLVPVLAQEFRKMQEDEAAGGYDTAVQRFLDRFGEGVFIYLAAKSYAVNPGISPTEEFGKWERQHGHLIDRYALVGAYFGPAGIEFSPEVLSSLIRRGRSEKRTPNERRAEANNVIGRSIYYARKEEIGDNPTPEQLAWLTNVRQDLERDYPGFSLAPTGKLEDQLLELDRAADDREVQTLPAGEALVIYMTKRDEALKAQIDQGISTSSKITSSAKGRHLRLWLRDVGEDLMAEYPEFRRVWEAVLSREIPEEPEEVAA